MDIDKYKDELKEIEDFLGKPDAYNSSDFATKSKRASLLREIVDLDAKITQMTANLEEAESLVNDPELGEIAREDVKNLKEEIEKAKAELEHDLDDLNSYLDRISDPNFTEMPLDFAEPEHVAEPEVAETPSDISDIAENPFEPKKQEGKQPKEKEEFKETVLEDDYQETQEFKEDSSEEVDSDYWDF